MTGSNSLKRVVKTMGTDNFIVDDPKTEKCLKVGQKKKEIKKSPL